MSHWLLECLVEMCLCLMNESWSSHKLCDVCTGRLTSFYKFSLHLNDLDPKITRVCKVTDIIFNYIKAFKSN